jgi:hypothetical protein
VVAEVARLHRTAGVVSDVPALAWFLLSSLAPLALGITALASSSCASTTRLKARGQRVDGVLPE